MLDHGNRTFIGSVVFVDIVRYTKKSVSEQITLKDRFTSLLADSLKDIALEQRIILDTGDGAAMSFLGDPEDALFVGMHMRDFLQRTYADLGLPDNAVQEDIDIGPQGDLSVRIGINLGPVKLIRDINGHPNIVGDGINVAQRIMSFARPGQIVVSRSYFDVVSVISEDYAKLFKYEGSRTDKHVREHEIYVVGESVAAFERARAGLADRAASTNSKERSPDHIGYATDTQSHNASQDGTGGEVSIPFLQDPEKLTIVGSVLGALVLALIVAAWMKNTPEPPKTVVANTPAGVQSVPPLPTPGASTMPSLEGSKTGESATIATAASPSTAPTSVAPVSVVNPTKSTTDDGKSAQSVAAKDVTLDVAKAAALKLSNQGTLRLRIDPWGQVFVNGRAIGVSPPLKQYSLAPGKYKIEVKNGTFTPYLTSIEVKAKEDVGVQYKFQ